MSDDYQRRSYGAIPVGTGDKPGIVVVDFQLGFTDRNIRWAARPW
jgi:maleamate amidohydrolase